MSDSRENNITPEDERLLDLLDGLGPETTAADAETLEALGALPYELAEISPDSAVKRGLLRRIEDSRQPIPFAQPQAEGDSARLVQLEKRARWYMPIAAALAVALIGLAGWQFRLLEGQRQTIAALSEQLESMERDGIELALARTRLNDLQSHMAMLTSRGSEFCVLKPYGEQPTHPNATATMVVSSDRNRWFLAAEGLEPCAKGRSYQVWFITETGPIRAAAFDGETSGGRVEVSGTHEGVPTTVRAITVTLEVEPEPAEPSAPILFADQAMTLL